jgi:hypothetical protein
MILPAEPILGLTGAPEHPLYPFALAVAAVGAAADGDRHAAETLCDQALDAAQRLGSDTDHLVDQIVANARSVVAFSAGALLDAATYMEHAVEIAQAAGRSAALPLGSAAMYRTMAGDNDTAAALATQGLALARRIGMPTAIATCLTALAGALADRDHDHARALLREALDLDARHDHEGWAEITPAALISALLQEWDQALDLASRSIRHLHWMGDRPLLGAMFNIAARALAPTSAESAAVIQGAAYAFATTATRPSATPPPAEAPPPPPTSAANSPRTSTASFVTNLRRETTGLLHDTLGQERLHELRAQGQAMNTDEAVAYALDTITSRPANRDRSDAAQTAD